MYKILYGMLGFILAIIIFNILMSLRGYGFSLDMLFGSIMLFFIPIGKSKLLYIIAIPLILWGIYLGNKIDKKVVKY